MREQLALLTLQGIVLLAIGLFGTAVVLTREPVRQAIAVSFYGLLLAVMFVLFKAPDVALAQLIVGEVALPLMILLAIGKARQPGRRRNQSDEKN